VIPETFDSPSKLAEKMPLLSLVTLTFAFYLDIQTGDQTRLPVNLAHIRSAVSEIFDLQTK